MRKQGFTLIELLVVVALIGIMAGIVTASFSAVRKTAYLARAKAEFKQLGIALELYANNNNGYPPDADRNIPPGLEPYLSGSGWPMAPWPNSIYDWDAWTPATLTYDPKEPVYQISVRFCPLGQPSMCQFPDEPWAQNFDYYSAAYFCVSGPCRAHSSQPLNHPGYCVNC